MEHVNSRSLILELSRVAGKENAFGKSQSGTGRERDRGEPIHPLPSNPLDYTSGTIRIGILCEVVD